MVTMLNMTTQSKQLVIPGNIQSGGSRWGLKAEISRGIEERIYIVHKIFSKFPVIFGAEEQTLSNSSHKFIQ